MVISVSEYSGIRTQTIHTLVKTAGYWQQPNKIKHADQWKKIENPELAYIAVAAP